jgi:Maltose operon periplasmic protein precursor (MalM)
MKLRAGLLVLAGSALLAACAGGPGAEQKVAQAKAALQSAAPCCTSLAQALRTPLPAAQTEVPVDERSQVYGFDDAKAYFVLLELPAFARQYSIDITSVASGSMQDQSVLVPRVALFDAGFKRTRLFDEKDLRRRGSNLERTVFINSADGQERYLAIYGAELPTLERSVANVTSTPVVAGTGVFNFVSGQDAKLSVRSSPTGMLRLQTVGLVSPNAGAK